MIIDIDCIAWWQKLKSVLEIGFGVTLWYHVKTILLLSISMNEVSGLRKKLFSLPHHAFFHIINMLWGMHDNR